MKDFMSNPKYPCQPNSDNDLSAKALKVKKKAAIKQAFYLVR